MYKIAVMGDRDSIYGFASLGLDLYICPVKDSAEAAKELRRKLGIAPTNQAHLYIKNIFYI